MPEIEIPELTAQLLKHAHSDKELDDIVGEALITYLIEQVDIPERKIARGPVPVDEQLEWTIDVVVTKNEPVEWDRLVSKLPVDDERKIQEKIHELQARGVVRYSGRRGGYVTGETPGEYREAISVDQIKETLGEID